MSYQTFRTGAAVILENFLSRLAISLYIIADNTLGSEAGKYWGT